jgi:WD40 repeat protein
MSGIPRTESLVEEDNYHNSRDSPNSMLEEFYDAPEDSPKPPDKRPSKGSSGPNSQRNSLEGNEQYINLKNFSGLTSPLKPENPHDDVSSLSSFSVENPERQDSKDSSIRDVPTPKRVSSAMKLFKNIEANNEPDDEDNEADEVAPPSTAPERYAFNHQSLSRRGIVAEVTDAVYDASNEIKNEDRRSAPRPPSIPRSSQHLSNPPIPKRHDSLKRRSVTVNEEVFLTSALFGLNDFQSTMQGSTPAMPSSSANPHHHSMTGSSATDLFKDKLRLAQTLNAHEGSVWAMKFSPNGQYLASGGQDTRVIIWCIAQLPKSTKQFEGSDSPLQSSANSVDEGEDGDQGKHRQSHSNSAAPSLIHSFLFPEPYRIYEGHTHDITDLAWSKSNFVLSSSMDKTVRLWHVSRNDCLQYFRHPDIVTCVDFHPLHDRFFVSGCFDRRLRVWDIIPTGSVREWVSANDTVRLYYQ